MERNTIEITAHTVIKIDETGVHNKTVIEVSASEEMNNVFFINLKRIDHNILIKQGFIIL